jgi:hypothetical protein
VGAPVKNYAERPGDVSKALQLLRRNGVPVGLPMQKADGEIIFPVNDLTITTAQILELFDKHELNAAAVRKIVRDSSSQAD